MKIAIIGTGNIGAALATKWVSKGHIINLGVKDKNNFKGMDLLKKENIEVYSIKEAVSVSDVLLIATPSTAIFEIAEQLGDVTGKIIIDATNNVGQKINPYPTVFHFLIEKTTAEVVKCFNCTGFENIVDTNYNGEAIDMFMAGDSDKAKSVAMQLAVDAGFGSCINFGKIDKVELLEKFALSWINLAVMQGHGRNIAFKIINR
jgi:8-hydroxy-5-deazaflavin:NADPH oxidoreductase